MTQRKNDPPDSPKRNPPKSSGGETPSTSSSKTTDSEESESSVQSATPSTPSAEPAKVSDLPITPLTEPGPPKDPSSALIADPAANPGYEEVTAEAIETSLTWSGPLPPPEYLRGYELVSRGAAGRLLTIFEGEALHRREMERQHLTALVDDRSRERDERRRGQYCGFAIGVVAIVAGAVVAIMGHGISGTLIGTGGVSGLVAAFVYGQRGASSGTRSQSVSSNSEAPASESQVPPTSQTAALSEPDANDPPSQGEESEE